MRRFVIALCLVCASTLIEGQQPPSPFKSGVTLVSIDVTVLDRDGNPVPGLTAEDFEVKLNGRVQPVRALTYVKAESKPAAPERAATPEGRRTVTNVAPQLGESRVFVIVVDDLSFLPGTGKRLFTAAQRFVAGLPPSDLVGFTATSGAGTVNPTADRAKIRAALGSAVGSFMDPRTIDPSGPIVGISESLDVDRNLASLKDIVARECFNGSMSAVNSQGSMLASSNPCVVEVQSRARRTATMTKATTERQLAAYTSVINAMRSATGIKHAILLTAGMGITYDIPRVPTVARAAAAAGVQVSVLVEEPDINVSEQGPSLEQQRAEPNFQKVRRVDDRFLIGGVQTVSDMAGGNFHRVIGTPDPFFQRVVGAASAVYRLGVEAPSDGVPGRDFALAATVRRPGLTARANRTAVAPVASAAPAAARLSVDDQLKGAIASGHLLSGVPISLATALRRAPNNAAQIDLGVNVEVPATAKGPLTTIFGLVDATGAIRSGRRVIEAPAGGGNYRLTFSVPVTPGEYRLRFAVADAAGSVGSLEAVVDARFSTMGPFTASDLLTWGVDESGQAQFLTLEELPASAKTLNASIELYPAAGATPPGDVRVRMTLTAIGQPKPAAERDIVPANANGMLHADAQFPLDQIPAGVYSLRATVFVGADSAGTALATIRKR